jgi:phospholipid/cholesterol/gamma-HCH transport system ATP-binding protein
MIRVENVHKWYGGQKVLDGISFDITTGSVTTIIGGSGAGKSVLIRLMIGLEQPDKGAIVIDGENIVGMRHSKLNTIRRRFGVLFQDGALFDSLSVRENVAFPRGIYACVKKEVKDCPLGKVGMSRHNKFPAQPGGMRKR